MIASPPGATTSTLALDDGQVAAAVRRLLDDPAATVGGATLEPVDYAFGSPTTAGLHRLRGQATSGGRVVGWSIFVKLLRSYRHWPLLPVLPADLRAEALSSPAWRYEADVYGGGLAAVLPPGLRLPQVLLVEELPDEHLVLLLEDVAHDPGPWDQHRFAQVAGLLGRLAVRLTRADALPPTAARVPGVVTRRFWTGRVEAAALPALRDERLWAHPWFGADPGLRRDLAELARRGPALLARLERLPQALGHGDASPQNLLVEQAPGHDVVAVDWMLGGLVAVGDDLGQLLVGLAHAGSLPVEALPDLREVIVPAYTAGLRAEGLSADEDAVRQGLDGGLVVRSAFTALPLERLAEPPSDELAELVAVRLRLTRYLVDLGLDLPT